jgi:AcrR family transcriptional regulator
MSAALRLFAAQGYERTSIEQISAAAGVAVGAFYVHFRSKRQLLLVLMDDFLNRLEKVKLVPPKADDVRGVIGQLLERAFASDLEYAGAYRAWREATLTAPDLMQHDRRIRQWTAARVTKVLARLRQLPGSREKLDIKPLARLLDSFFWAIIAESPTLSRHQLTKAVGGTTHLIYHAMFVDRPAKSGSKTHSSQTG